MSARRVLVTGSSRGIGKAIALHLAKQGWQVAVHYAQDQLSAKQTFNELGGAFAGLYQTDLADSTKASELFSKVLEDGPLHAIVNNAGVYLPISFVDSEDEAFEDSYEKSFTVNFESPLRLSRLAARHFIKNGGGKILNVASRVGFKGEAGAALYAASKAALINLTRSLAVELASRNIQTFGIAPGWTETAMARKGMDERLPQILRDIPLGRMASVDDCGAVSAFLLSDAASYLSGVVVDINGASYFH